MGTKDQHRSDESSDEACSMQTLHSSRQHRQMDYTLDRHFSSALLQVYSYPPLLLRVPLTVACKINTLSNQRQLWRDAQKRVQVQVKQHVPIFQGNHSTIISLDYYNFAHWDLIS